MSEYENPFVRCLKLGKAKRDAMGVDYTALFRNDSTRHSRLSTPGTYIDGHNRVAQLRHADPSVHRHASKPVKPLTVATIDAQELDEPEQEVEQSEDDVELLAPVPEIRAGVEAEEPMQIEIGTTGIVRLDTGITFFARIIGLDPLTVDGGEEFGLLEISPSEFEAEADGTEDTEEMVEAGGQNDRLQYLISTLGPDAYLVNHEVSIFVKRFGYLRLLKAVWIGAVWDVKIWAGVL